MSHDTKEARRLLLALADPYTFQKKQDAAAKKLISEFLQAISDLPHLNLLDETAFYMDDMGAARLRPSTGGIAVWAQDRSGYKSSELLEAKLVYDAVDDAFVSSERDQELVPEPGKPYPRRNPMTVLAETCVEALNGLRKQ